MKTFYAYLKANPGLSVLLIAFLALAIFYSLIIPIFEGPDEDDHFRYVKFIADYHALPVQSFGPGGGEAGHQGWQPPLYYSLAAILIAPINTFDFPQFSTRRNEYVTLVGDPTCCGRNIYYHGDSENFPYTHTTLAVHLARLLSILFGAITLAATYAIARAITNLQSLISDNPLFALAAASIVAFNPSFLFISALVSNDTALTAFGSLVLLIWVKLAGGKLALNFKSAAMLGTLIGLATLTKTTALGLVPLSILLIAILAWRQRNLHAFFFAAFAFFVPFALLMSWWFVRNQILYGDPLAAWLVEVTALFPRAGDLTVAEFFQISLPQFWTTFWGGPTPSDFSPIILIVLAVLTLLAFIGVILAFIRISNFEFSISIVFIASWLVLLFIAMIQFIRITQGGDQGRYLFPAISAFAFFFVLGLNELAQRIISNYASRIAQYALRTTNLSLVISSFVIAIAVPFANTLPAYARPPLLAQNDLVRFSGAARTNFANQIELLGYELDARSRKPGETLRVALYWRALAPMPASYRVFVHLIGQNDRVAGSVDAIPARGAFPTLYWKPGDAMRDTYSLPIANNAIPGKYSIEVGLYPIGNPGERLTVVGSDDDRVLLVPIKIAPRETPTYAPSTRVNANFANQIELMGYDASASQDRVRLILYWRARAATDRDYTVFVHALDALGKIIAQADQEPQGGNYPISIWEAGEQVRDEYALTMPTKIFRIELGLYRADTGERLPVLSENGSVSDNVVLTLAP